MGVIDDWVSHITHVKATTGDWPKSIHMLDSDWAEVKHEMVRGGEGSAHFDNVKTTPFPTIHGIPVKICEIGDIVESPRGGIWRKIR